MTFDKEKTINYWLESSEYDLQTAESLYESHRYPYSLFFGHLAIEKVLKALVVEQTNSQAPITHSLPLLASKCSFEIPGEISDGLNVFMEFYVEARYPEEMQDYYQKCTNEFTRTNLDNIKRVHQWFRQKLAR